MPNCTSIHISVPSGPDAVSSVAELRRRLDAIRDPQYAEVWVDHGAFPSLCALINGDRGWLMLLRYDGDAGFSSRNPNYDGPPNATIEYLVGNAQRDRYPAAWAYPIDVVVDALIGFAETKRVPESLTWFNDSEDDATSPNDASTCNG
jgi:hypothetical protein